MNLIQELKRRNVVRVGIAYVLIAWLLLQAADFGLDLIDAPNWVIQALFLLAAIGLPAVLVFSWVFEMTPDGIKREADIDHSASVTPHTGRKLDKAIIACLVLVIAVLGVERFWPAKQSVQPGPELSLTSAQQPPETPDAVEPDDSAEAASANSIAVLPFVNMSDDAANEFFSDGVSEEILNVLAGIPELKVAARTSSFYYKGRDANVADIAQDLGVNHILEGSVRKAGNQVRVTAQLIQADDGFHLWSESYDRELDNIFAIQDDIAQRIADALRVTLVISEDSSQNLTGTSNIAAYEHYLRGMSLWHERTAVSLRAARSAFEAAVQADPQFAAAWSGLAMTWAVWTGYISSDPATSLARTRENSERALALDPDSVEARVALGNAAAGNPAMWDESRQLFETAIELSPSFATAFQWYSRLKLYQGDFEAARPMMLRAQALDPRSRIIATNLAWLGITENRIAQATSDMEQALDRFPEFPDALSGMLVLRLMAKDCNGVLELARRQVAALGKRQDFSANYLALCESSTVEESERLFQEMLDWGPVRYADPDSRHLLYDIELWFIATQYGAQNAAAELFMHMTQTLNAGELSWPRNDRRPGAMIFNCSETARSMYAAAGAAPMRDQSLCEQD